MQDSLSNMPLEKIKHIATNLMTKAGLMAKDLTCKRIIRGGNNQSFRIDSDQGTFFLKYYFQSLEDKRDRLDAEFSFVSFCNQNNIKRVPKALTCDKNNGFALYSWIEGKSFTNTISEKHINEAALFLKELAENSLELTKYNTDNSIKYGKECEREHNTEISKLHNIENSIEHGKYKVQDIKSASDAYFTLTEHLTSLEFRIKNLKENFVTQDTALAKKAFILLQKKIIPQWEHLAQELKVFCSNADNDYVEHFILSPSDFGFHNALETDKGIVFLDFEYAGKDGSVKILCDFVCQPDFPVSESYLAVLAGAIHKDSKKAQILLLRAQTLLPICRLKWCCIMLNQFTKLGASRRYFANNTDMQTQQKRQLDKIQNYMNLHFIKS